MSNEDEYQKSVRTKFRYCLGTSHHRNCNCRTLISFLIACILAEEIDFEIGHFLQHSDLRNHDLGLGHMEYRRVSLYMPNFVQMGKTLWTDGPWTGRLGDSWRVKTREDMKTVPNNIWNAYVFEVLNEEIDVESAERNHHGELGISTRLSSHVIETLGKMYVLQSQCLQSSQCIHQWRHTNDSTQPAVITECMCAWQFSLSESHCRQDATVQLITSLVIQRYKLLRQPPSRAQRCLNS